MESLERVSSGWDSLHTVLVGKDHLIFHLWNDTGVQWKEWVGISTVVEELTSCICQTREVWTQGMIDKLTVTAEENWKS